MGRRFFFFFYFWCRGMFWGVTRWKVNDLFVWASFYDLISGLGHEQHTGDFPALIFSYRLTKQTNKLRSQTQVRAWHNKNACHWPAPPGDWFRGSEITRHSAFSSLPGLWDLVMVASVCLNSGCSREGPLERSLVVVALHLDLFSEENECV